MKGPAASLFARVPGVAALPEADLDAAQVLRTYEARNPVWPDKESSQVPDSYFRRPDQLHLHGLPLRWLEMLATPLWAFDINLGRFIWANSHAIALWNAASLAELHARDMSPMSDVALSRVSHLMQQLQVDEPVLNWTFYPKGKPPIHMKIRHIPLAIGDRPYSGFLCQGWGVETLDPNSLRGVTAVDYIASLIAVYEWHPDTSAASESASDSKNQTKKDPRGRPLMRNNAASKLYGPVLNDSNYASSESGNDSNDASNEDPEFLLGETFVNRSQISEMVESLLTHGRWTCDELAIRGKPRRLSAPDPVLAAAEEPRCPRADHEDSEDPEVKYFSYTARITDDPVTSNPVILVNASDVSERRKLARLLEKAKKKAEAASKSKSMFLANISHDLRTPMTGILSVVDLLRSYDLPAEQRALLETLSASGEILLALVNDLLDFSKIEAGQLSLEHVPFSLRKLLSDVTDLLRPRASAKGLKLIVSPSLHRTSSNRHAGSGEFIVLSSDGNPIAPTDPGWLPSRVIGDSTRLKQILFNLIGNSLKFTPAPPESEGVVEVEVSFTHDRECEGAKESGPRVFNPAMGSAVFQESRSPTDQTGMDGQTSYFARRSASLDGTFSHGTLRVSVRDTGIGLSEEQKGHLFQPFSQGDSSMTRRFGGTGLGLAISRKLVELMDGQIGMSSKGLGQGSEFWFEVPIVYQEDENLPEHCVAVKDEDGFIPAVSPVRTTPPVEFPVCGEVNVGSEQAAESPPPPTPLSARSSGELFDGTCPSNRGSSETITLAPPPSAPARKGILASIPQYDPRTILLAEDNEMNARVLQRMLEKLGHSVKVVGDGQQAIDAARAKAEEDRAAAIASGKDPDGLARECQIGYDVILMDNQMPLVSGPEATRAIREFPPELNPNVGIVALSADALNESRERSQGSGGDAYVTKPVDWARLSRVIDRVVRTKRAESWRSEEE